MEGEAAEAAGFADRRLAKGQTKRLTVPAVRGEIPAWGVDETALPCPPLQTVSVTAAGWEIVARTTGDAMARVKGATR